MTEFEMIMAIMGQVGEMGSWIVFLFLLIRESNMHEVTRNLYRKDLRKVAGLKPDDDPDD